MPGELSLWLWEPDLAIKLLMLSDLLRFLCVEGARERLCSNKGAWLHSHCYCLTRLICKKSSNFKPCCIFPEGGINALYKVKTRMIWTDLNLPRRVAFTGKPVMTCSECKESHHSWCLGRAPVGRASLVCLSIPSTPWRGCLMMARDQNVPYFKEHS